MLAFLGRFSIGTSVQRNPPPKWFIRLHLFVSWLLRGVERKRQPLVKCSEDSFPGPTKFHIEVV